jgi:23S rRNA (uracil1939-C5)-methyltransferase
VPQIEVALPTTQSRWSCASSRTDRAGPRTAAAIRARSRVQIYLQPGGYETIAPLSDVTPLEYRLPQFDVTLRFQPNDFRAGQRELNCAMVARAVELAGARTRRAGARSVLRLGNFSLPLARSGAHVVGVEGRCRTRGARQANAALNGIANIEFVTRRSRAAVGSRYGMGARAYDKVLLDPPRPAHRKVLPIVARSGAKSCCTSRVIPAAWRATRASWCTSMASRCARPA